MTLYLNIELRVNTTGRLFIVFGLASDHGLTVIEKTKAMDNPSGFTWKALEAMQKKSKPNNVMAEIALNNDLDNIKFTLAKKSYNDVIAVTARYNVPVSKIESIKKFAKRL